MEEKLRLAIISAMKAKDKDTLSALKVLKGEIDRINPKGGVSDAEISGIAKKLITSIKELGGNQEEINIFSEYMLKQLGDTELANLITNIIAEKQLTDMKGLGVVMASLNKTHKGLFDGAKANSIYKEKVLNG